MAWKTRYSAHSVTIRTKILQAQKFRLGVQNFCTYQPTTGVCGESIGRVAEGNETVRCNQENWVELTRQHDSANEEHDGVVEQRCRFLPEGGLVDETREVLTC